MATRRTAHTRATLALTLLGVVAAMFFFAAPLFGLDASGLARHWLSGARGPWALPVVVGAFAALAFIGAPQIVLIAACVAVFGPIQGGLFAWTGTLISALLGFSIGRVAGARALRDTGDPRLDRFMAMIGRNGLLGSLLVRLVPIAPFVMVNVAAGVAPITAFDFAVGTAIGIIPKIALTAFAGDALTRMIAHAGG